MAIIRWLELVKDKELMKYCYKINYHLFMIYCCQYRGNISSKMLKLWSILGEMFLLYYMHSDVYTSCNYYYTILCYPRYRLQLYLLFDNFERNWNKCWCSKHYIVSFDNSKALLFKQCCSIRLTRQYVCKGIVC